MIDAELLNRRVALVPPQAWFGVSAIFHYLGPAFAVLLFPSIGVLGVAWLRIASAALLFAPVTKPWRTFATASRRDRFLLLALGLCLAGMNCAFYLALERLPISLVAAMEFVGTIGVALWGLRTGRNLVALALAVAGVFVLINVQWSGDPTGLLWAGLNAALFIAPSRGCLVDQVQVRYAALGLEVMGSLFARQKAGALSNVEADRQVWRRLAA